MKHTTKIPRTILLYSFAALIAAAPLLTPSTAKAAPISSISGYGALEPVVPLSNAIPFDYFTKTKMASYDSGVVIGGWSYAGADTYSLSFDNGETWIEHAFAGQDPQSTPADLFAVSGNGQTLLLGDTIYDTNSGTRSWSNLSITHNKGVSWQTVAVPFSTTNTAWASAYLSSNGQHITLIASDAVSTNMHIYVSSDGGLTWDQKFVDETTDESLATTRFVSISTNGSTIVTLNALKDTAHLSFDYGATWHLVSDFPDDALSIDSISLLPGSKYFQATKFNTQTGNHEVYFSPNTGTNTFDWKLADPATTQQAWYQMSAQDHPDNSITLQTRTPSTALYYRSNDGGVTWQALTNLSPESHVSFSPNGLAGSLHVIENDRQVIYKTTDAGHTWVPTPPVANDTNQRASVAAVSNDGSTIITSSYDGAGMRLLTFVQGSNQWKSPVNKGLRSYSNVKTSADGSVVFAIASNGNELLISRDGGVNWDIQHQPDTTSYAITTSALSTNGKTILIPLIKYGADARMLYSSNSGQTWNTHSFNNYRRISNITVSGDGKTAVASGVTQDSQYEQIISYDSGATWNAVTIPGLTVPGTVVLTANGSTIYAEGENNQQVNIIKKTTNGGQTWSTLTIPNQYPYAYLDNASLDGKTVSVATYDQYWNDGPILISHDSGATWQPTVNLFAYYTLATNEKIISMSFDGKILYAAGYPTGSSETVELYSSSNGGTSWSTPDFGEPGTKLPIDTLHISQTGQIIAELYDENYENKTLKISTDKGLTWQNLGVTDSDTLNLANNYFIVPSEDASTIYAYGSTPGYLYKATKTKSLIPLEFNPATSAPSSPPQSSDRSNPQVITNNRPTFNGISEPFAVVTVTVNSNPIICTTTADENGNWSCTLPSNIPVGVHTITTVVYNALLGTTQTVGPYYIQIGPGEVVSGGSSTGIITGSNGSVGVPNTGFKANQTAPMVVVALLALIAAASLGFWIHRRSQQ